MKVLVACEFSGVVRDALIARGHDAMSCDLLPTERPGPHHTGDVRDILDEGWDMMIAHPPCTHLAVSGGTPLFEGRGHALIGLEWQHQSAIRDCAERREWCARSRTR